MNTKQEEALREYLKEAIVPLIEQVLVKKLGQAMSFAASELVQPQRKWIGLSEKEMYKLWLTVDEEVDRMAFGKAVEAKLKEKNNG